MIFRHIVIVYLTAFLSQYARVNKLSRLEHSNDDVAGRYTNFQVAVENHFRPNNVSVDNFISKTKKKKRKYEHFLLGTKGAPSIICGTARGV